jgi:hypothetical protein
MNREILRRKSGTIPSLFLMIMTFPAGPKIRDIIRDQ